MNDDMGAGIRKAAYKIIGRLMQQMEISSATGSFGATKEEIMLLRACVQSFTDLRADERAEIKTIDLSNMTREELDKLAGIVLKESTDTTFEVPSNANISGFKRDTLPPKTSAPRR
jgi:hypothetical protein